MTATKINLTTSKIKSAYGRVCVRLDCDTGLIASTKREMCEILGCDPWQLEEVLTDDVIEEVLFG